MFKWTQDMGLMSLKQENLHGTLKKRRGKTLKKPLNHVGTNNSIALHWLWFTPWYKGYDQKANPSAWNQALVGTWGARTLTKPSYNLGL